MRSNIITAGIAAIAKRNIKRAKIKILMMNCGLKPIYGTKMS
ncbi:MAG: hypothetical protein ACFE9J_09955 [Candidatus Hermodarchaeota archaeon]